MRIFGTVSASQCVDYPDDLSSFFEACGNHWFVYEIGYEWISRDEHVSAGHENWHQNSSKTFKEAPQSQPVVVRQNRKSRDRFTLATVKFGRNTPDTALASSQLS